MTRSCRPSEKQAPPVRGTNRGCAPKLPTTAIDFTGQQTQSKGWNGDNVITSAAHNLDLEALCARLGRFGPLEKQPCYTYVVETLRLDEDGNVKQTASAPNFCGGFITLLTCKHSTRTVLSPSQWRDGVWVAGMTGSGAKFGHRQSLAFLMRVGEAYASQFDLAQALRASGRSTTLDAKNASRHVNGDVLIPRHEQLTHTQRVSPDFYHPPILPHAHRTSHDDTYWHKDVDYVARGGSRPAYLVGDPANSFTWSRQMIFNARPGNLRPHRAWPLGQLVDYLKA